MTRKMSLSLRLLTVEGEEIQEPYLIRIGGWSEERYFREAPETRIVEFEDGEIIVHSPAGIRHQQVTGFLTFLLRGYGETKSLGITLNGPAVVRLRPGLLYEPDIFFVRSEQLTHLETEYFSGSPALIVEIVSRGSRGYDLKTKAASYHEHQVEEYWVVDVEKECLFQYLLSSDYQPASISQGRVRSHAVPGFWLEASWLWQKALPSAPSCLKQILDPKGSPE
jgi:Uma2 family endonuclease